MLDQNRAGELFAQIKKHSSADEIEVLFYDVHSALTRFANNTIHQNVAEENQVISVRSAFGQRTARATTNRTDNDSLRRVVQASESLAKVQNEDADLLPVPRPENDAVEGPTRYFAQTAALTPLHRAEAVGEIVKIAGRNHLTAAGVFSSSEISEGIFNSRDLQRWHRQSSSEISVTMLAQDSSGWQKANSPDLNNLNPRTLAEVAAKKALDSAHPQEASAGKYTVVLEPAAVLDIVGFMFFDFSGMAILDQRSFLNDRVGKQIFGANINISDEVNHPLQSGAPFDGEGVPRQRIDLVENGTVKRLVYARATAERIKNSEFKDKLGPISTTGHGFPLPNEMGEAPMNIVFQPPEKPQTVDQMIAETERGIYVTRFWYIREVDPYEKILTGMTRDGTFLIENGKLRHGVLNFRFNESLLHMLSNVEAMGIPVRSSGEESFDMVVPPMKVKNFNFTEVTRF